MMTRRYWANWILIIIDQTVNIINNEEDGMISSNERNYWK